MSTEADELRAKLAECEKAHAAEVAEVVRLRTTLEELKREYETHLHDPQRGTTYKWSLTRINYALTTPPTAAAQAVRELIHATYEVIGGMRARRVVFPDAPAPRTALNRLDAALSAYEKVIHGQTDIL